MKNIIIITGIVLTSFGLYFYSQRSSNIEVQQEQFRIKVEPQLLLEVEFQDEKVNFINDKFLGEYGSIDNNLIILSNGVEKTIDTYQFAGYNEEKIEEIFVYPSKEGDLLVVITSWDSYNRAMGTYGNFYEVYFYNSFLEKEKSLMGKFEPGYDGESNLGNFSYKYKTKQSVIDRLERLGY